MNNEFLNNSAPSLPDGIRLFQEGRYQEAVPILEAHAHEDALVAMLAGKALKMQGDEAGYKRYLFMAADGFGSGDAALLLAQEYLQEEAYTSALTWAERAGKAQTPGAGQLILRLSEKTGQWEKCLRLALADLEWLRGYDRYSLCEEIGELLNGNHYQDEVILELVGPVLGSLDDDPVAKECLESAYRNAETRKLNREKQEQDRKLQEDLARQAQQDKQAAKVQAAERAKKAVKEAAKAKRSAERKANAKSTFGSAFYILCIAVPVIVMPILFNFIAHALLTQGEIGFGYVIGAPFLGYVAVALCTWLTSLLMRGERFDFFLFVWLSPLQLAIIWLPVGFLLAWTEIPLFREEWELAAPYAMGIVNCYLQEIRVLINGGDVSLD